MRVGILMPVYNADPQVLTYAVQSALRQTHTDVVVCVHRDGGADVSWLAELDARVRVSGSAENRGRGAARQQLLDELPPDIDAFTWLDADDALMPAAVETAMRWVPQREGFWFVRLLLSWTRRVDQSKPLVMRRYLLEALSGDLSGFAVKQLHAPGRGIAGALPGLYLPRMCASWVRFESINHDEDMHWSSALLKLLKDRMTVGGRVVDLGVVHEQLPDAGYVRLAPLSDRAKYQ
jgi:glycosyltransferase involved in cell wall biosynthesis